MKLIFLGSGSSSGVPKLGCLCPICCSSEILDKRTRASIAIKTETNKTILIDTSPDLRFQLLKTGIKYINEILFTHHHADHTLGIYDVTKIIGQTKEMIRVYCTRNTYKTIKSLLNIVHSEIGNIEFIIIEMEKDKVVSPCILQFENISVYPMPIWHGIEIILAFLITNTNTNVRVAYVTDCSLIPPDIKLKLRGIDILILGVLKQTSDPLHFGLCDLPNLIDDINPKQIYLTHLSHSISHKSINVLKYNNVICAYDGLEIDI